jgi:histone deacetylase 1/2
MVYEYDVQQIDFDTAFLNATLPEEYKIFMKQPEGFLHPMYPNFVCLLKKSLYGLKQAPKEWNSMLHQYLLKSGYQRNWKDYGLYYKKVEKDIILVVVYVDDVLSLDQPNLLQSLFKNSRPTLVSRNWVKYQSSWGWKSTTV